MLPIQMLSPLFDGLQKPIFLCHFVNFVDLVLGTNLSSHSKSSVNTLVMIFISVVYFFIININCVVCLCMELNRWKIIM